MQMNEEIKQNEPVMPQVAIENTDGQKEEKVFTQAQLEEIIAQRLSRERKTNDSLVSLKKLLKSASEKGILKGTSYAEMAAELGERLSLSKNSVRDEGIAENPTDDNVEKSHLEGEKEALSDGEDRGISGADENAEEKDVANDNGENEADGNMAQAFVKMLSAIKAKNSPQNVEKLFTGNLFESFAKGRRGSVEEIFDDFCRFMSVAMPGERENVRDEDESYYSSTAFSAHSGRSADAFGLTKQQMEIARSSGMSYREYASLLEAIPKGHEKQIQ